MSDYRKMFAEQEAARMLAKKRAEAEQRRRRLALQMEREEYLKKLRAEHPELLPRQ